MPWHRVITTKLELSSSDHNTCLHSPLQKEVEGGGGGNGGGGGSG